MEKHRDQVLKLLKESSGDVRKAAAAAISGGSDELLLYLVRFGIAHVKASERAVRRRELRREISAELFALRGLGEFKLTERAKKNILVMTKKWFGPEGYQIGDINISEFTKEDLLKEAFRERQSADGHARNARRWEILAEPMKPGQRVRDYWKPEQIAKLLRRELQQSNF